MKALGDELLLSEGFLEELHQDAEYGSLRLLLEFQRRRMKGRGTSKSVRICLRITKSSGKRIELNGDQSNERRREGSGRRAEEILDSVSDSFSGRARNGEKEDIGERRSRRRMWAMCFLGVGEELSASTTRRRSSEDREERLRVISRGKKARFDVPEMNSEEAFEENVANGRECFVIFEQFREETWETLLLGADRGEGVRIGPLKFSWSRGKRPRREAMKEGYFPSPSRGRRFLRGV